MIYCNFSVSGWNFQSSVLLSPCLPTLPSSSPFSCPPALKKLLVVLVLVPLLLLPASTLPTVLSAAAARPVPSAASPSTLPAPAPAPAPALAPALAHLCSIFLLLFLLS